MPLDDLWFEYNVTFYLQQSYFSCLSIASSFLRFDTLLNSCNRMRSVTPNWTLPRVAGGIANYLWHRWNPEGATNHMIVLASGFVLGEGIASILNAAVKGAGIINSSWVVCWGCPAGFCTGCS